MQAAAKILIAVVFAIQLAEGLRTNSLKESNYLKVHSENNVNITDEKSHASEQNEVDVDRIEFGEVYKSLLRTTIRFTLEQTRIPKYVKVDTAIAWLDKLAYKVARLSTLIALTKTAAIAVVSLLITTLIFPNTYQQIESKIREQRRQFIPSNINPDSVVDMLSQSTENALDRFGLVSDTICRERSVCLIGSIVRCSFPESSEILNNYVEENMPKIETSRNKYTKAFTKGFYDQNCETYEANSKNAPKCPGVSTEFIGIWNKILFGDPRHESEGTTNLKK